MRPGEGQQQEGELVLGLVLVPLPLLACLYDGLDDGHSQLPQQQQGQQECCCGCGRS